MFYILCVCITIISVVYIICSAIENINNAKYRDEISDEDIEKLINKIDEMNERKENK